MKQKPTTAPPLDSTSPRVDPDGLAVYTKTLGRAVVCPECGASPRKRCHQATGEPTGAHLARVALALTAVARPRA